MTDWAGGRERRKPTACKPEDVHLVELDESWKKSHGLSSAVQCRPSDVREKGLFFFVYDMAWVRPFGIRHLITADSLRVLSSAGCAHKSHLGGTGAIQKFEV